VLGVQPSADRQGGCTSRRQWCELPRHVGAQNDSHRTSNDNDAQRRQQATGAVAILSADLDAHPIASTTLRYLRPIRTGPAVARAEVEAELGSVEVHDAGTNQLAVLATTRFFGS